MPKVTIYILNYNYGKYVSKAIESALEQTYSDIEVLVIDDGSSDNSLDVIGQYNDRVTIIKQNNMGLVKSIVKAFSMAKGEYVVRLDADDWLEKPFVEKLVKKIDGNTNAALVFPDYYEVDELGQIIRHVKRHDFSGNVTMYDQPAHGACTLIRKEFYFDVGGHNESISCQDGVDIWLSLTQKYDVVNINEPLFYYRKHSRSLTVNEGKILSTRGDIFKHHALRRGYRKEKTFAFIPVRSQMINDAEYALTKLGNVPILDWVVQKAKLSELIDQVIIMVDSSSLYENICNLYEQNTYITVSKREKEDSLSGVSINESIRKYIDSHCESNLQNIVLLTLDYPFSRHNYIDTAIYSMYLFGSNSIDSVIMDNSIFYYHDGNGLKPWVDSYIRKEREDIYLRKGGISVYKKGLLESHSNIISDKMGHVIIDKISSFEIRSSEDIKIAEFIGKNLLTKG